MKHHHIRRLCATSESPAINPPRGSLSASQRAEVLVETGATCYVCGGRAGSRWQADHIKPYRLGGAHVVENFLPICRPCNLLRRGHGPDVLRLIMRLGTYARKEIRQETEVGEELIRIVLQRQRS